MKCGESFQQGESAWKSWGGFASAEKEVNAPPPVEGTVGFWRLAFTGPSIPLGLCGRALVQTAAADMQHFKQAPTH